MKKILYIISTLGRSGPNNQLHALINHLDRSRFEPQILTLSPEPENSRYSDFEKAGITIESLTQNRLSGLFNNASGISRAICRCQPNLIHTSGIRADIAAALLKTPPHVATIHNILSEDYQMTYGRLKGALMEKIHVYGMRKIDLLVGVSHAVTNNLSNRYQLSNTHSIQNGIDDGFFYPLSQEDKMKKREQLGLPLKSTIIISVGHLSPRKNPLAIIKTFRNSNTDKNVTLLFLGKGSLEKTCQQTASNDSRILFLGFKNNVQEYLQASDIFVSASKSEGFPGTVLESLSTGLPCILSDIPQHREFFDFSDNIGRLFSLDKQADLQKAIREILSISRTKISLNARSMVEKHLSAKIMAKKYQAIYNDLTSV